MDKAPTSETAVTPTVGDRSEEAFSEEEFSEEEFSEEEFSEEEYYVRYLRKAICKVTDSVHPRGFRTRGEPDLLEPFPQRAQDTKRSN